MNGETVNKVLQGHASKKDAAHVVSWFQKPEGSMDLVNRINDDLNQAWEQQYNSMQPAHSLKHALSRVAVVMLIIVGCLLSSYSAYRYFIYPMPISDQVAHAARGERTQVVLQDGTRIYLNSESQITFPSRFSLIERRIHLDGEAYFEVSKNKHRPFVVEMDHATVTVLGTHFNVSSYCNENVRVMLDEGSIVFSAEGIEDVILKPGEMVDYNTQLATTNIQKVPVLSAGAWHNHRIDVNNMPLQEFAKLLERNYDVTFQIHNSKCYQHSFTLSMEDYSLREVLSRMDRMSPLSLRYDEKNRKVDVY